MPRRLLEDRFRAAQNSLCPPEPSLGTPDVTAAREHSAERLDDRRWMNTDQACEYLAFTGKDRLNSLYRWLDAQGVRRHYRSSMRLLLLRADLDDAIKRPASVRRRNRIKRVA
jgi:hypothetical protein